MAFPNRAVLEAPVARDLFAESGRPAVRIPNATNGVLQLWDTLDEDYFVALADAQIVIYPNLQAIPLSRRKFCAQFIRYNTSAGNTGALWKRWQDCLASDFIQTNNGVKAVTLLIAGDRPLEMDLLHHWFGNVQETLGSVTG